MLLKRVLFLSVFFRGFRGHNIHHYQTETVLVLSLPSRKIGDVALSADVPV